MKSIILCGMLFLVQKCRIPVNLENGKFNRDQFKMQTLQLQTEIWATPSYKSGILSLRFGSGAIV